MSRKSVRKRRNRIFYYAGRIVSKAQMIRIVILEFLLTVSMLVSLVLFFHGLEQEIDRGTAYALERGYPVPPDAELHFTGFFIIAAIAFIVFGPHIHWGKIILAIKDAIYMSSNVIDEDWADHESPIML
jgi:multidrug transporter EmrE-like cation transporter